MSLKPKDKAVVAGQQTVLQGVPGHVCGRPRTGYLGADGPQSTGPANWNSADCPALLEEGVLRLSDGN
jgi:hypothetical protein